MWFSVAGSRTEATPAKKKKKKKTTRPPACSIVPHESDDLVDRRPHELYEEVVRSRARHSTITAETGRLKRIMTAVAEQQQQQQEASHQGVLFPSDATGARNIEPAARGGPRSPSRRAAISVDEFAEWIEVLSRIQAVAAAGAGGPASDPPPRLSRGATRLAEELDDVAETRARRAPTEHDVDTSSDAALLETACGVTQIHDDDGGGGGPGRPSWAAAAAADDPEAATPTRRAHDVFLEHASQKSRRRRRDRDLERQRSAAEMYPCCGDAAGYSAACFVRDAPVDHGTGVRRYSCVVDAPSCSLF